MRPALVAIVLTISLQAFGQQPPADRMNEEITVERVILDARVRDRNGAIITNLTKSDFRVLIDDLPAQVESVEWIVDNKPAEETVAEAPKPRSEDPAVARMEDEIAFPKGRMLIFFWQTDFGRILFRTRGQMKAMLYADRIINDLRPEDRIAVFSYDSHLKFHLDFTDDHELVKRVCRKTMAIEEVPLPKLTPMPSIGSRLEQDEMHAVTTPNRALFLIGNAVRHIPGPKSLLLFGWGLGEMKNGAVSMGRDYSDARYALEAARVSIFALDFTLAEGHTLAAGMQKASADTGGTYGSLNVLPFVAIDEVKRTISGHYEIEIRKPQLETVGEHSVDISVPGKKGLVVLAPRTYIDVDYLHMTGRIPR